jgi:hypothetical protein
LWVAKGERVAASVSVALDYMDIIAAFDAAPKTIALNSDDRFDLRLNSENRSP